MTVNETPGRHARPSPMSDLSARVSAAELEAQLEALGDWQALLGAELAEMDAASKRLRSGLKRPT